MENNLDDILVDNPENNENKGAESKRKILIGVASGLLIAVVVLAIYFVFTKEDKPQTLEVTNSELEQFIGPSEEIVVQDETQPQIDDSGLEQLIIDMEAGQAEDVMQGIPSQTPQTKVDSAKEQKSKDQKSKDQKSKEKPKVATEEAKKIEQSKAQKPQNTQVAQEKTPTKQAQPANQPSKKADKPVAKATQPAQKASTQAKPVAKSSDAVETKIPQGFYLQVGSFSGKPNANFLNKIAQFPYKVRKSDRSGKVAYLIGGYKTRAEAESKMDEVAQKVGESFIIEIR